jgi:uncharacterized protein YndB with AHSA1/START domain
MSSFSADPDAPAHARRSRRIAAPPRLVWTVLSDIPRWPDWNPSVTRMRMHDPVAQGAVFRWTGGGLPIRSRLEVVKPGAAIGWTGRAPGIRARHVWRLSAEAEGTLVTTEEAFHGILARIMPGAMTRAIETALEQGLDALEAECLRRIMAERGA